MGSSLSPEVENRIRQKVAAGAVSSVEAFVDTALRQALGLGREDQVSHDEKTPERLEMRSDLLLSTLRKTVEAMGGNLSLAAEFPDRAPVVLSGIAADDPAPKKPAGRRPGRALER